MGRVVLTAGAFALSATSVMAAGVERSTQSVAFMFEEGRYAEFSLGYVSPDVSGTLAGASSGDMTGNYVNFSLAYKMPLTEQLELGFVLDQPIGADVDYPAGTGYAFAGSTATLEALAATAILRYKMPSNVSVFGGVRLQQTKGDVDLTAPGLGNYTLGTSRETDVGYLVGAAYERPDIALRVALTYNSEIEHTFDVTENGGPSLPFTTIIPESLNLEFQTGIAADTLLFGSVRYVNWTDFDISPAGYVGVVGAPLVSYANDGTTFNLGVGRRFNETWSGAVTVGYEKTHGDVVGNLGPTDGQRSIGLATTYTQGNMKITGGVRYIDIGDANTTATALFEDNSGWAAGIRIGYSF